MQHDERCVSALYKTQPVFSIIMAGVGNLSICINQIINSTHFVLFSEIPNHRQSWARPRKIGLNSVFFACCDGFLFVQVIFANFLLKPFSLFLQLLHPFPYDYFYPAKIHFFSSQLQVFSDQTKRAEIAPARRYS